MRQKSLLLTLALLVLASWTFAQERQITGVVTDAATGDPLIGATVQVVGEATGTITDVDGNFSLNAETGQTLSVSYIGYEPTEVVVGPEDNYNVSLRPSTVALEEVVVIGYGESQRRDLTGSIVRIDAEEISKRPSFQVAQALQGQASGVQVVNSGQPGEQPVIRVRGTGTVLAGANPLYVVDGVLTNDISNLNPNDIESVDVLKDASSLAIYGLRGANGVVIITTKKGRGKPTITLNLRNGFNQAVNLVEMADARLFAEYTNEMLANSGQPPRFDLDNLPPYNTDWYDAVLRTGYVQSYAASLSGGSDEFDYYLSLGFDDEEGILQKNQFQRISARLTGNYDVNDRISVGTVLSLARTDTDNPLLGAFQNAYNQWPTIPVRFDDGSFGFDPESNVANPVASLAFHNNNAISNRLQGSIYGEVEILDGLSFKSTFNLDRENFERSNYNPVFEVSPNQFNEISDLTLVDGNRSRWIWDNILTYQTSFAGRHFLTVMGGLTSEEFTFRSVEGRSEKVPNNEANWYIGAGENRAIIDDGDRRKRFSYLGRLQYNFDDRYFLTGSVRRESSSRFAEGNRTKVFPAVGVAWKISSENFMANQGLFDFLKVRASWGQIGNDNIPSDAFIVLAEPDFNFDFSGTGNFTPGIQIRNLKDENLGWETTTGLDIGLEAGFLNERLGLEVVYYDKLTEDVLLQTVVNRVFGDADRRILTNLGDVSNTGVELALTYAQTIGQDWRFNIGVNGTYNENTLESLGNGVELSTGTAGISEPVIRIVEGEPIGSFWVYETNGIFQSQEEIENSGITRWPQTNMQAGDFRFVDQNGDGIVNEADRVLKGSHQPRFYYGINIGAGWRGLNLALNLYGNHGNFIYNGKKSLVLEERNIEASRADRWSPSNPSNSEPRATQDRQAPSDYYLEPGDFLRINTINLSYELPASILDNLRMQRASIFLNVQNPVTFTPFSGFHVEFPGPPTDNGIEQSAYPQTAVYSVGLNLQF